MSRNEFVQFRSLRPWAVAGLAVILTVLAPVLFAPTASAKDNPEDISRVYTHTYDEVFQASGEAIERMGLFVTGTDKDNGTITGNGDYYPKGARIPTKVDFKIHIESVSPKPETRVTVYVEPKGFARGFVRKQLPTVMFIELQKVLATYK